MRRLRAIRLRALADSPDAFGTTLDEAGVLPIEDWQRQLAQLVTFIARTDERDVGIIRTAHHDERDATAWLLSMWVSPEMRRKGIASSLVDSVVAWARGEGRRRIVLDVTETNAAAIALYRAKGFSPNGTIGMLPPPRQHIRECQMERITADDSDVVTRAVAGTSRDRRRQETTEKIEAGVLPGTLTTAKRVHFFLKNLQAGVDFDLAHSTNGVE